MKPSIAVTIIIFAIVAIVHILRLFYGWPVMIGGIVIPMSASVAGVILPIIMIVWLWCGCCPGKKSPEQDKNSKAF